MDDRLDVFTMMPAVFETPSCDAVIVAVPDAIAVTMPALTEAIATEELLHFAVLVTSLLSPSPVVPLAVNCLLSPMVRKMEVGLTLMVLSELPETKKSPQPLPKNENRTAIGKDRGRTPEVHDSPKIPMINCQYICKMNIFSSFFSEPV